MPKISIRCVATSHDGLAVALAEFERNAYVWDMETRSLVSTFRTTLDFGGTRLAITSDGRHCVVGAYNVYGIAAYSSETGQEVWRRKDLKKVHYIRISPNDECVYCGFSGKTFNVLNLATGSTKATWRGVKDVWESAYEPALLIEKRDLILRTVDNRQIATVPRTTFAVLSVAFGPGRACVSESGGPVRCLDTENGIEIWRFSPEPGSHFLRLAFCDSIGRFVGIIWPYEHGDPFKLIQFFSESGRPQEITTLPQAAEYEFCRKGAKLVSSDGNIWDVSSGTICDSFVLPEAV